MNYKNLLEWRGDNILNPGQVQVQKQKLKTVNIQRLINQEKNRTECMFHLHPDISLWYGAQTEIDHFTKFVETMRTLLREGSV